MRRIRNSQAVRATSPMGWRTTESFGVTSCAHSGWSKASRDMSFGHLMPNASKARRTQAANRLLLTMIAVGVSVAAQHFRQPGGDVCGLVAGAFQDGCDDIGAGVVGGGAQGGNALAGGNQAAQSDHEQDAAVAECDQAVRGFRHGAAIIEGDLIKSASGDGAVDHHQRRAGAGDGFQGFVRAQAGHQNNATDMVVQQRGDPLRVPMWGSSWLRICMMPKPRLEATSSNASTSLAK